MSPSAGYPNVAYSLPDPEVIEKAKKAVPINPYISNKCICCGGPKLGVGNLHFAHRPPEKLTSCRLDTMRKVFDPEDPELIHSKTPKHYDAKFRCIVHHQNEGHYGTCFHCWSKARVEWETLLVEDAKQSFVQVFETSPGPDFATVQQVAASMFSGVDYATTSATSPFLPSVQSIKGAIYDLLDPDVAKKSLSYFSPTGHQGPISLISSSTFEPPVYEHYLQMNKTAFEACGIPASVLMPHDSIASSASAMKILHQDMQNSASFSKLKAKK